MFHGATAKWLHSHAHRSPITPNQEVSAFGSPTESNSADNWRIEVETGGAWSKDSKVFERGKKKPKYRYY